MATIQAIGKSADDSSVDSDPTTDGRSAGGGPRLPGRGEEPTQPPPSRHADNNDRGSVRPLPATGYGILASPRKPALTRHQPAATPVAQPEPQAPPVPTLPPSLPPETQAATSFESQAAPTVVLDRQAASQPEQVAAPTPGTANGPAVTPSAGTPQQAAVAAGLAAGGHVLGNPLSPPDTTGPVEINPNTGLPMHATGPLTPTPQWKPRVPTKGKKVRNAVITIVVITVVVGLLFLLFRGFLPSGDPEGDDATSVVDAIDETDALVADVNDRSEVEAALDELGLDELGQEVDSEAGSQSGDAVVVEPVPPTTPAPAPPAFASYQFTWSGPGGFDIEASVDTATRDFVATTGTGNEVRRIDGQFLVSRDDGSWTELDPTAAGAIPVIGIDGPMTVRDVLPDVLDEFVISLETRRVDTTAVLIDDAWLSEINPGAREAWLRPWGLLDQPVFAPEVERSEGAPVPDEAAGGEVVMLIKFVPSTGVVLEAVVSSPAIGGTGTYTLVDLSDQPVVVADPLADAG